VARSAEVTRFGSESTVSGVPAKHSEVARRDGYAADGKRPHRRRIGADVRPSWAPNDRIVLEPERQKLTGFGRAWWHQLEKQAVLRSA
jgi:hypothetical protein